MSFSSSSATVAVEKATSDLLIGPDWTMNIDICDSINANLWQAKDVVKAVKKRLQHKSSKVQLLALTLLETMVKNCGDYVHFQIAEKNILGEMVKIVKKRVDMQVRDKILVLLDSWQEAFGGPGGKHPQYYWAYEELRRSGVEFPQRSLDAAPIFTPPVSHPTLRHAQAGFGMPSNSTRRLDETMALEIESLSLSSLDSMRNVMELLSDMLQAVNPGDRLAVKDDVIVDLVNRCRTNQKKLMQMLTTTGDEELLGRGLELNDSLQTLLANHDAIASASPLPTQMTNLNSISAEANVSSIKPTEERDISPRPNDNQPAPVAVVPRAQIDEEEEEEDDFAQLARRHSKPQPTIPSESTVAASSEGLVSMNSGKTPAPCYALALPDPPAPVKTTKEQDIMELLSITLSTIPTSPQTTHTPSVSNQSTHQVPVSPNAHCHASPTYPNNQARMSYNSYVVPWAQPQPQPQLQPLNPPQLQTQYQQQLQSPIQPPVQPQYSSGYPPPPWATTPGYFNNPSHLAFNNNNNMFSTPRAEMIAAQTPMQGARSLQQYNSFPARGNNNGAPSMNGDVRMSYGPRNPAPQPAQRPFVPSYRLFEDLNVLGNGDGRFKMSGSTSHSLSGTSGQGMVSGRK